MKILKITNILSAAAALTLLAPLAVFAAPPASVNLGTADGFTVLAGTTVTNTGATVINGDLGLAPGSSVTGFEPGKVTGAQYIATSTAVQAKADLVTAYNDAAGRTPAVTVPTELGGTTKTAGVYNSLSGTFEITGTLTLDGEGDPNSVFIFQTASTLVTAVDSNVVLINGASAKNVFWQVGSSATLQTYSTFKGTILALTSITVTTGVQVEGRVLAQNGAVTLDTDTITNPTSPVPQFPDTGETGGSAPWNIIIPAGIVVALLALYLTRNRWAM